MATSPQEAWVVRVLGIDTAVVRPSPSGDDDDDAAVPIQPRREGKLVAYRKALLDFRAARADIRTQLAALSDRIKSRLPEEAKLADAVAADVEAFCDDLNDSIDKGINTVSEDRHEINEKIRDDIGSLIESIGTNRLIAHIDRNPVIPTNVAQTLTVALARVANTIA